jgi:hypothetical protein
VDRVHKLTGFIKVSMKAAHYRILHYDATCCQQEARVFKRACPGMLMSASDEHEQEAFGPDAIAVLAVALEDTLRQLRLVDRNDPATTKVAKKSSSLPGEESAIPSGCVRKLLHLSAKTGHGSTSYGARSNACSKPGRWSGGQRAPRTPGAWLSSAIRETLHAFL